MEALRELDPGANLPPKQVSLPSAQPLWVFKGLLYYLSFLGPVVLISSIQNFPIAVLLAVAIVGYAFSGFVFLSLLILVKSSLIGPVQATGWTTLQTENGRRWCFAGVLTYIMLESCFRSMTSFFSPLSTFYHKGMGAKIAGSLVLGTGARISDPWFVEIGANVLVGADAVILGHLGDHHRVFLGRVTIGEGTVVGMRSVIFPDVRIGRNVRIGAGSVVVRGTTIPDGETWAGVPARKSGPKTLVAATGE